MFRYFLIISYVSVVLAANAGYLPGRRVLSASSLNPQQTQQVSHAASVPHSATQNREFFYFHAPNDQSAQQSEALQRLAVTPTNKNLQVVFIKAPENKGYERTVQKLASNAAESQQTKIYVLQKEHNLAGLAHKIQSTQQAGSHYNRPEVHFVKYRTPQEAAHAQETIIRQFETLPGKSTHINASGTYSGASSNRQIAIVDAPKTGTNAPVEKGYAKDFLPSGVDVVPGSSYIPLAART